MANQWERRGRVASASHHSADVSMYLEVGGRRLDVAACVENSCELREPARVEPCDAELVIMIDGQADRYVVTLPNGASGDSLDVEFKKRF